jgi:hypothetical protein
MGSVVGLRNESKIYAIFVLSQKDESGILKPDITLRLI